MNEPGAIDVQQRVDRQARVTRQTRETQVQVRLVLDGQGAGSIATGIGFFDHLLRSLAHHALFDLDIEASGDLEVDDDEACIARVREYLSYFPANCEEQPPRRTVSDPVDRREDALLDVLPDSNRKP